MRETLVLMAIVSCLASPTLGEPVLVVSLTAEGCVADRQVIGVGGHVTLQVQAQVAGYASADDGLFSYDVNAVFGSAGNVGIVPNSISQPGSEAPMSAGTAGAGGLAKCYGTYFYEQGYGIGGPKELVSFDVTGMALGTVVVTVTPDTTIGADFLLHESSAFTVDYSAAHASIVVVGPGDANGDGVVDAADYIAMKRNFGTASGATWQQGDFNGNHQVDWADLQILLANFGAGNHTPATTPEPATLGLLALCGLAVIRRRKAGK